MADTSLGARVQESGGSNGNTVDQAREKASDLVGQAREQASQATEQGKSAIKGVVDERSTQLGEQLGSQVDDLRTVGKELRNQGKETPARVADQLAERGDRLASYLRDADGDQMLRDVEQFARSNPWAVVAGGLAAGFLLSRFLKAGSDRRYESSARSYRGGGSYDGDAVRDRDEIRASLESRGIPAETTAGSVSGFADSPASEDS